MYSRYNNRPERPIKVPENYSGYAFSERREPQNDIPHRIDVAKPTPAPAKETPSDIAMPPPPRTLLLPPAKASESKVSTPLEKVAETASTPLFEGVPEKRGTKTFPFGHGIGFEEMLLIGLIILLHGSEQGSDTVLWLALLLFMG